MKRVQKRCGKKHKHIPTLWDVLEALTPVVVRKKLPPRYKMSWGFKQNWGHLAKEKEATVAERELYWGCIVERPDGRRNATAYTASGIKVPETKFKLMMEFGWLYEKEGGEFGPRNRGYRYWHLTKKGKEAVREHSEKYKKQLCHLREKHAA